MEDIFLDPTTCAMAFRILRLNGYDVSSGLIICKHLSSVEFLFTKKTEEANQPIVSSQIHFINIRKIIFLIP